MDNYRMYIKKKMNLKVINCYISLAAFTQG